MKLWVCGGQGMLGRSLQQMCVQKGICCVATSRNEADLTDLSQLMQLAKQIQPSHIVNCAAYTDVDGAEKNESTAFAVNATGAQNLALTALDVKAKFIHISTDYVFDGFAAAPYREEDLANPINAYGRSKWEGERCVLNAFPKACIIRTSWLFGARGKNLISSVLSWLQEKEKIQVVFDQRGRPTFVMDLARAVFDLLDVEGIVHFANAVPVTRYQLAVDVRDEMLKRGKPVRCTQIEAVCGLQFPTLAQRPSYSVLATEKFTQITGKQPRPWMEAIGEYFEHLSNAS